MAKKFSNKMLSMFEKKEKEEDIGAIFDDEAKTPTQPPSNPKNEQHQTQPNNLQNKVLMFGGTSSTSSTEKKPPEQKKENQFSHKMKMFEDKKEDKKEEKKEGNHAHSKIPMFGITKKEEKKEENKADNKKPNEGIASKMNMFSGKEAISSDKNEKKEEPKK